MSYIAQGRVGPTIGGIVLALLAAAPCPAAGAPDEQALARQLRRLSTMRRGRMGAFVIDDRGKVLYSRRGQLAFNPASNIKVITAAAALAKLGADYRFTTEIRGAQAGEVVTGPLYLRGFGDPALSSDDLLGMVRQLRARGITRVKGPIYVDASAFRVGRDPPGFRSFRSSGAYRAGAGALSLNANVVRIIVAPGARSGARAAVDIYPASPYLRVRARARTSGWRNRLRVTTFREGNSRTGVIVSGWIRRGQPRRFWRRVFHPDLYAGHSLLAELQRAGISVAVPRVRRRRVPRRGRPKVLVWHRSPPLSALVRSTLKVSSNMKAEQIFLTLGAAVYGYPATYQKGRRAVRAFLRRIGLRPRTWRIHNGSGLSRRSRVRPAQMARALYAINRDFTAVPELLAALPIGGHDGTLRGSYRRSRAKGAVRAKTGTLGGTSCLSGYVAHGARRVFFSFMSCRVRKFWSVRRRQVAMTEAIYDYLQRVEPGTRKAQAVAGGELHARTTSR